LNSVLIEQALIVLRLCLFNRVDLLLLHTKDRNLNHLVHRAFSKFCMGLRVVTLPDMPLI